ncbi:FHA domain-containing protein [Hyphomicrobium sp. LHD-15]|uniref:FHA domain-containing protein n=1 Tax=Hyphomicrobium sp. LHD-15 TaxID=3072142 RepID=UPI0028107ECB|nr:FHA domain-containing protein [Hyphomicrobium sp. LHD-15]MDQ8697194.1 FHA domain-containing protein [Hyphomicrobium sp. LHD-15]
MPLENRRTRGGVVLRALALSAVAIVVAGLAPLASRAFDAHRVEPSVYKIYTFIPEKNQFTVSSGTGFLISGRRYVMTNFHVVENGARFYIAFRDGREAKLVEAKRADARPNIDLALLEAREDLPGEPLILGEYEPEKLAEVVAIGYPGAANLNKELVPGPDARGVPLTDLESTITTGVVSRMTFTNLKVSETQVLSARTVQHNSAINPGNSGGPLFDACGLVVGINTLQGLNSQGLFFSIHANEVGRFLREGQIAFASSSRPCSGGPGSVLPLLVAMTAVLALAAAVYAIRKQGTAPLRAALPEVISRHIPLIGPQTGGAGEKKISVRRLLPLRDNASAAGLLVLRPLESGETIRLDETGRAVTIGRGPGTDIVVASDTVSKLHARLAYDRKAQRIHVTDLNSSNGTYLDGVWIREADAAAGSVLRFGTVDYELLLEKPAAKSAPEAAAAAHGMGWMLSGFDPSGRALQFELRPVIDPQSGRELPATWTFGRDPGRASFVIDDGSVSALHAQLMFNPGEALMLRDINSMNGTKLDGESIGKRTVTITGAGNQITFGLATLRLSRL